MIVFGYYIAPLLGYERKLNCERMKRRYISKTVWLSGSKSKRKAPQITNRILPKNFGVHVTRGKLETHHSRTRIPTRVLAHQVVDQRVIAHGMMGVHQKRSGVFVILMCRFVGRLRQRQVERLEERKFALTYRIEESFLYAI